MKCLILGSLFLVSSTLYAADESVTVIPRVSMNRDTVLEDSSEREQEYFVNDSSVAIAFHLGASF